MVRVFVGKALVAWAIVAGIAHGSHAVDLTANADIPRCAYEDGSDVDGLCVWIDPDTGDAYLNPTPEEVNR